MASFQIFESDNKIFHLNIENGLFVLLILFGILFHYNILNPGAKYILFLVMLSGFILLFVNFFRIKPLYGKLNSLIIFNPKFIQIKENVYPIESISKVFIRMDDFEDHEFTRIRPSFYPRISNGTNNLLRMELKSGETIITFFKSDLEYDYEKLRPFIVSLIYYNLLSADDGLKILRLETKSSFLELKSEVNKKELN